MRPKGMRNAALLTGMVFLLAQAGKMPAASVENDSRIENRKEQTSEAGKRQSEYPVPEEPVEMQVEKDCEEPAEMQVERGCEEQEEMQPDPDSVEQAEIPPEEEFEEQKEIRPEENFDEQPGIALTQEAANEYENPADDVISPESFYEEPAGYEEPVVPEEELPAAETINEEPAGYEEPGVPEELPGAEEINEEAAGYEEPGVPEEELPGAGEINEEAAGYEESGVPEEELPAAETINEEAAGYEESGVPEEELPAAGTINEEPAGYDNPGETAHGEVSEEPASEPVLAELVSTAPDEETDRPETVSVEPDTETVLSEKYVTEPDTETVLSERFVTEPDTETVLAERFVTETEPEKVLPEGTGQEGTDLEGPETEGEEPIVFEMSPGSVEPDTQIPVPEETQTKEDVAFTVKINEKLVDTGSLQVQAVRYGDENGECSVETMMSDEDGTVRCVLKGIPDDSSGDGIYIVTATAVDQEGNRIVSQQEIRINRYGSVYSADTETAEMLKEGYHQTPFPLHLTEKNVDTLSDSVLVISRNGEETAAIESSTLTVLEETDKFGWKNYSYLVSADLFEEEGNYAVRMFSDDKAGNHNYSGSGGETIDFSIDRTAPDLMVPDLSDGAVFRTDEIWFCLHARDGSPLQEMCVYCNGEILARSEGDQILPSENMLKWRLRENKEEQKLRFYARDAAGNESWSEEISVLVSGEPDEI